MTGFFLLDSYVSLLWMLALLHGRHRVELV